MTDNDLLVFSMMENVTCIFTKFMFVFHKDFITSMMKDMNLEPARYYGHLSDFPNDYPEENVGR